MIRAVMSLGPQVGSQRSSAPAALDRFALSQCAKQLEAQLHSRPDAEIFGGEVSRRTPLARH
jgi:hypothetical protein